VHLINVSRRNKGVDRARRCFPSARVYISTVEGWQLGLTIASLMFFGSFCGGNIGHVLKSFQGINKSQK
jgi:hypothetical protein